MIIILIGLIALFSSCGNSVKTEIVSTDLSFIEDWVNNSERLQEYDSKYTLCFKNKNKTYTLFTFASPIQYKVGKRYNIIDNTVVLSSFKDFAFENKANDIKTYFPKTLNDSFRIEREKEYIEFKTNWDISAFSEAEKIEYENMYDDNVSAVRYNNKDFDVVFYPVRSGIKAEIIIKNKPKKKTFSFQLATSGDSCQDEKNGYVTFYKDKGNLGIIHAPIIKKTVLDNDLNQGEYIINQFIEIEQKNNNQYTLSFTVEDNLIDENTDYPFKFDMSFEMKTENMPDSNVYSRFNKNCYLRPYSVIGNHSILGEGWGYLRFRLAYFMYINTKQISSVSYNIRQLEMKGENMTVDMYKMDEQWSSTSINWFQKVMPGEKIISHVNGNSTQNTYLQFDITEFAKDCYNDPKWGKESQGGVMKVSGGNDYLILATADNVMYVPYIRIDFKGEPERFSPLDIINP